MAIHYATASIKRHRIISERREVYLSWTTTTSTEFNRLKFCLTSRHREYLTNIDPEEIQAWPRHTEIVSLARDIKPLAWIGKGIEISGFKPGSRTRMLRVSETGALLEFNNDDCSGYDLRIWLGPHSLDLKLYEFENSHYSHKGEGYFSSEDLYVKTSKLRPDQL